MKNELFFFFSNSHYGHPYYDEAALNFHNSQYWISDMGQENWNIHDFHISQHVDGRVR